MGVPTFEKFAVFVENEEQSLEFRKWVEENYDVRWNNGCTPTGWDPHIIQYFLIVNINHNGIFWAKKCENDRIERVYEFVGDFKDFKNQYMTIDYNDISHFEF